MNKIFVSTLFVILSASLCFASPKDDSKKVMITNWLQTDGVDLHLPAFHSTQSVDGKTFELKNLLQEKQLDIKKINPAENEILNWEGQALKWKKKTAATNNLISLGKSPNQLYYLVSYLSTDQWAKVKVTLNAWPMAEVYVDGEKKISHDQHENKEVKEITQEFNLEQGKHCIVVKVISGAENNELSLAFEASENWDASLFTTSLSPKQFFNINKVLDGKNVGDISLSPNGELALISYSQTLPPSDKTERWKEIQDVATGKILHTFRGSELSNFQWLPIGNAISYTQSENETTSLFTFDFETGSEKEIASNISDFGSYTWSPNGNQIVYSIQKDYSEDWKLRKIQGMEDRLPWFRSRSFLYLFDVESGVQQRLTYGSVSTQLNDISPDGKNILFTQSRPDYNEYPYDKQNLYQMNLETFKVDTLWSNKLFGGFAQYSPDGKQLLVQGGPSCFGKIGENIGKQPLANNYDGQLYILDLKTQKVDPITLNFNPSVVQSFWNKTDGNIYLKANDQDYVRLFRYQTKSRTFTALETKSDVIRAFSLSQNGQSIAYTACSISSPYKAFVYNLAKNLSTTVSDPQKENLQQVEFGKTEDWNFTKADGKTIIGRVYYPPNFDASKKYPVIVNYYAGTSPVERSFGGRYPLNLYAAMGYVVYLLQPSGAVGFGQEFSSEHQNNWGISTADEIIEGTKKFLEAHPFANAKKVGCIGASYGGFMTMLLQTRTDIFAAAISHAGISNIASYWGEGYWGYSYSVNASGKSFPWNNQQLYINQSPLFNADKVVTPMLLIHGSVDTNVPLGESIQMYQALKLLGKDVDFVQVKNQDHHISNYTQRILWNNTIFAYFAKYLKDQPQWWNELYPDKNL